jgi:hypothetical protein
VNAKTFAKVENGIVTDIRVVTHDFIVANPDRYGDASLWVECFQDGSGRGYCGVGWAYDADNDVFVEPVVEEPVSEVVE